MNKEDHFFTIVSEECSEIIKQCSKALRFGKNDFYGHNASETMTNEELILYEFNDLVGALELLYNKPVSELLNKDLIQEKKDKILRFLKYSKKVNRLDDE